MPIKWTPETDQILLLKILETSNVSTDAKAISAAWPKNHEAPTPRAIIERIHKIRTMAKSASSSSSKSDASPRPVKSAGSPGKRKRADEKVKSNGQPMKSEPQNSDDDLYGDDSTPTKKAKADAKVGSP